MPNVSFKRKELRDMEATYDLIEDTVAGETAVKARRTKYLPMPNAADQSLANQARYTAYITRAVFYNVSRRTLAGLVGEVFDTEPVAKLPTILDPVVKDASGGGISLEQVAKRATRLGLSAGRGGILTDFPTAPPGGFPLTMIQEGKVRPTLTVYEPKKIINWRVKEIDGIDTLVLVVLEEDYVVKDDGFEETRATQWRALRLVGGQYVVEIYRTKYGAPEETFSPKDAAGNPLTEIPFAFFGSENNDPDVDEAPMYDLCSLNVAHYRNSADYEEATFIVGQPTPWFAGLTEAWVTDVLGGQIPLGSRAAVALPEGGSAGLLQVTETTMAFEAMDHKERQMVALGAKIVQEKETQRTATEAKIDNRSETSILATVAGNITNAIERSLKWCMLFINGDTTTELEYKLNTEYALSTLTPEEQNAVVQSWQNKALTFTEMRDRLRHAGLATQDDTKAREEIDADTKAADAAEVEKTNKIAEGAAQAANKFPKPTA